MTSRNLRLVSLFVLGGAVGTASAACGSSDSTGSSAQRVSPSTDGGADASDGGGGGRGDAGDAGDAGETGPTFVQVVRRTDIVSSQAGALVRDPALLNAWGLAFNPTGVAWVSANGSGTSAIYTAQGAAAIPAVTIPAPAGAKGPSTPTGQVFNGDVTAFDSDSFIFVTEDGTIAGWTPSGGATAYTRVDNSANGAVYKGVAIATNADKPQLFAANFKGGTVDVFDAAYAPVQTRGSFSDPDLPSGFAPFNVVEDGGDLIVTYAKQDDNREDDVAGAGLGYVDLFDVDGELIVRLISQGALNAPWGVALSPSTFGDVPRRMYVGNFGDGAINVYRLKNVDGLARLVHEGALTDADGKPLAIDGLWALAFGPDAGGFSASSLYFTAGPNQEKDGVFGQLDLLSSSQ